MVEFILRLGEEFEVLVDVDVKSPGMEEKEARPGADTEVGIGPELADMMDSGRVDDRASAVVEVKMLPRPGTAFPETPLVPAVPGMMLANQFDILPPIPADCESVADALYGLVAL